MTQSFKLASMNTGASAWLMGISAACAMFAIAPMMMFPAHPLVMSIVAIPMLGLAALFAWFLLASRRNSVSVDANGLVLRVPFYGRKIAIDRLVDGESESISTARTEAVRLKWRTNGLGVPGYSLGWFRTQGGVKALAAISSEEVTVVRTKDDYLMILSVNDRDGFLAALRGAVAGKP